MSISTVFSFSHFFRNVFWFFQSIAVFQVFHFNEWWIVSFWKHFIDYDAKWPHIRFHAEFLFCPRFRSCLDGHPWHWIRCLRMKKLVWSPIPIRSHSYPWFLFIIFTSVQSPWQAEIADFYRFVLTQQDIPSSQVTVYDGRIVWSQRWQPTCHLDRPIEQIQYCEWEGGCQWGSEGCVRRSRFCEKVGFQNEFYTKNKLGNVPLICFRP